MSLGLPPDLTWYKLLTDWGSVIGGLTALIGWNFWPNIATRQATNRQISALARKDRLQAQCIAVAISPELLNLKVRYERASKPRTALASIAFYVAAAARSPLHQGPVGISSGLGKRHCPV